MDETPKRQPTHLTLADRRGLRSGSPVHCECAVPRFDNVTLDDSKHYGWIGALGALVAPAGATVERCCACGLPSKEQHDAWEAVLAARDEARMQALVEGLQAALEKVSAAFGTCAQVLGEFVRRARAEQVPDDTVQRMVLDCAQVWGTPAGIMTSCMTCLSRWAAGEAWSRWIWGPAHHTILAHFTHDVIDGAKVYTYEAPRSLVPEAGEHPEVTEFAPFDGGLCVVFPIGGQPNAMTSLIRIAASQGAKRVVLVGTSEELAAWRKGHEAVARAERHLRGDATAALMLASRCLLGVSNGLRSFAATHGLCEDVLVERAKHLSRTTPLTFDQACAAVQQEALREMEAKPARTFVGVDFGCDMGTALVPSKVHPDGTSEVTHLEVRRTPEWTRKVAAAIPASTRDLVLVGDMADRFDVRQAMNRPTAMTLLLKPWWDGPVERIIGRENVLGSAPAKYLNALREADVIVLIGRESAAVIESNGHVLTVPRDAGTVYLGPGLADTIKAEKRQMQAAIATDAPALAKEAVFNTRQVEWLLANDHITTAQGWELIALRFDRDCPSGMGLPSHIEPTMRPSEIRRLLDLAMKIAPSPYEQAQTKSAPSECTGIAASWCPVHGDCSCPRAEDGGPVYEVTPPGFGVQVMEDLKCPLHGVGTTHGDDWPEPTTMNASPPCGMLTPPAVVRQAEAALGCSLSPAYAHAPGSLDAYPLGQAPGERLHGEMRAAAERLYAEADGTLLREFTIPSVPRPLMTSAQMRGEWKVQSSPYEKPIFVDKTTFKVVVP